MCEAAQAMPDVRYDLNVCFRNVKTNLSNLSIPRFESGAELAMQLKDIEVRIAESYSAEDRLSLSGGDADPAQTNSYQLQWRPKEQHVLILQAGRTVCHVGLVEHTVQVGEARVRVAGIGGVLTQPELRGQGLARMAMQRAEEFALRTMGIDFGLLFCRPAMQQWYASLGWAAISEPVWIEQPQGTIQAPLVVMVKAFRRQGWPGGPLRLGCLPW